MAKYVLYPVVPRVRQSFVGVKRVTIPNQCMSLQEMLRRFVRREPLPVERQGVFIESDYDLEKLSTLDRTEQDEVVADMKRDVASKKKKVDDAKAKVAAAAKAKEDALFKPVPPSPSPTSPPVSGS